MSELEGFDPADRDRFVSVAKLLAMVLLAVMASWIVSALALAVLDETWLLVVASAAVYITCILVAAALLGARGLDWRRFVGGYPNGAVRVSVLSGVGAVALTFGCVWLVYLPLSYVLPEYTLDWLMTSDVDLLVTVNGESAYWQNLFTVVVIVGLAPVMEEFVFRGLLLHRLAERYGGVAAVAVSAVLFGVVHPEMLGHTLFGIVAALLYLRTGSLWAPIILHATNNAVALSLELIASQEPQASITLEGFRDQWLFGFIGLAIGVPWFVWVCKLAGSATLWALPYDRNSPIAPTQSQSCGS